MKRQLASLTIAVVSTLALTGCISQRIPEVQEAKPIVVPESLKPTDVPEPMQTRDEACAASWAKYSTALSEYQAEVAKAPGANEALVLTPDWSDPLVKSYFDHVATAQVAYGTALTAIADDLNNAQIEKLLTTIGDAEIAAGRFAEKMTDPSTTDTVRTAAAAEYAEALPQLAEYVSLCEGSIRTGGDA